MTETKINHREQLLHIFMSDRALAHKMLFPHRHKDESPEFHHDILDLLYSDNPLVVLMAFRGAAKSTLLEEYILVSILFGDRKFCLIVGSNWESACQRLAAVRQEIETNDLIMELFGDQKASPWAVDEIVLANGAKIKAIGAGQSMRGVKHNEDRPDLAVIDDLEDEQNVHTEEARRKMDRWLNGTLRPALHPTQGSVRFIGTPLHPRALIQRKSEDPEWVSRQFPIIILDLETGREHSAWPARFPIDHIIKLRSEYIKNGNLIEFNQEYMCRAEDVAGKPFQASMLRIEPHQHRFTFMVVDPARTTKSTSARTGYTMFEWIGTRLIVHEAEGHFHKPDEIIAKIVEWDKKYKPIRIGVEANGLEEFLMQPLRSVQLQLGYSMPIVPIYAPRDKLRFIEGLQPFYRAGEVIHSKSLPDLESELLQFPTGRNDVVNALAYAPTMRAGLPVYEDFTKDHIAPVLEVHKVMPRYLVMSSRPSMTAAALVQYVDGMIRVYADWVRNEPPNEAFKNILREAILISGGEVKVAAPAEQFDKYNNFGLPAAAKQQRIELQKTSACPPSEGRLREWLRKQVRGLPAVLISENARWVVNGLASGYARRLNKAGLLAEQPEDNQYRLVIEAIESFVMWFDGKSGDDVDTKRNFAYTQNGRRFLSSLPR